MKKMFWAFIAVILLSKFLVGCEGVDGLSDLGEMNQTVEEPYRSGVGGI